jgi:hypothetical protein
MPDGREGTLTHREGDPAPRRPFKSGTIMLPYDWDIRDGLSVLPADGDGSPQGWPRGGTGVTLEPAEGESRTGSDG